MVNDALKLPRGKLAAQVAHASIGAFLGADNDLRTAWLRCGMPKIVLTCPSGLDLNALLARAEAISIPAFLVRDAGKTVLSAGTITCLGLGPAPTADIDTLTRDFALL